MQSGTSPRLTCALTALARRQRPFPPGLPFTCSCLPTPPRPPTLQCNVTGDLGWLCSGCSGDEPEFCTDCQGDYEGELDYGAYANELGQCMAVRGAQHTGAAERGHVRVAGGARAGATALHCTAAAGARLPAAAAVLRIARAQPASPIHLAISPPAPASVPPCSAL